MTSDKNVVLDNAVNKQQWQQCTSEVVYENAWIRVDHDTVLTPGGNEGVYGCVHFKNHAVGILAIDQKGWTWLVQQTRYPHGCMTWEIPEGGSPENEDCLSSAKRELVEEVGLTATQWDEWLQLQLSNSVTDEVATIYLAQNLSQGATNHEDTEDIMVKHLPLKEAIEMVHSGEIVDAMSVASLLKAASDLRFLAFLSV